MCGDDLLCHQCDEKNEAGLKLIALGKAAAAAPQAREESSDNIDGAMANDARPFHNQLIQLNLSEDRHSAHVVWVKVIFNFNFNFIQFIIPR